MLKKFIIEKKLLKQLNFSALIVMVIISAFGIINILSATGYTTTGVVNYKSAMLQTAWLIIGLIIIYIILVFDYSVLGSYAYVLYWICNALLLFTFVTANAIKGSKNWITLIGDRAIQPSEFAKLALIILIAKKIEDMDGEINKPKNFLKLMIYILIPMVLILAGKDMGMTMVIFFMVLGMFYIAGLNLKVIFGGFFGLIVLIAVVWFCGIIQPYQKTRIISFINPKADTLSSNYQKDGSVMAIASGGIFGDGFSQGTLVHGSRIPEDSTDFIFTVVGEEWGLIGTLALLLMYMILLTKLINIARNSKDIFGTVMCAGIISGMIFSIVQNMCMAIGMLPITGLTLPFFSYGGSSMLTNCIGVGIILNVGMRKKKINF